MDHGFALSKWYLDVAAADGRSAILYWTSLGWGPFRLRWSGLSLHQPGKPATHRSSLRRVPAPGWEDDAIRWSSPALGCVAECEPWQRPFTASLLDAPTGSVRWHCEAPSAHVRLRLAHGPGGLEICGAGYAERVELTIAPWRLPISGLRWGRWACPDTKRSVVWIDWRGAQPLTLVLVDGRPAQSASVEDDVVRFDGCELRLRESATLHRRTLRQVLDRVPLLVKALPGRWESLEDRKSRSVGTLGAERGWAIHEIVRFP